MGLPLGFRRALECAMRHRSVALDQRRGHELLEVCSWEAGFELNGSLHL